MDPFFFFFTRFKVLERIWLRLYANEQNIIYTVHNFTLVTSGQIGKNFKLYDFHSVLQKKKKRKKLEIRRFIQVAFSFLNPGLRKTASIIYT